MHAPAAYFTVALTFCSALAAVPPPAGQGFASPLPASHGAAPALPPISADSSASAAEDRELLRLRIAFFDTVGLTAELAAAMRGDVEAIFRQMAVEIEWHTPKWAADGPGEETETYYLKVLLSGYAPRTIRQPAEAMGASIGSSFPPDAVWLFDKVIRGALRGDPRRPRPLDDAQVARAYARVLAHEVIHGLSPHRRHAPRGLMASNMNRNALVGARIEIDDDTVREVRQGIRRIYAAGDGPSR